MHSGSRRWRPVPQESPSWRLSRSAISGSPSTMRMAGLRAPVSSGQTGYETPAGVYSVIQKEEEHYSNLYDDASMPFMQRITWSGIALHAGALPASAASHGCIWIPLRFAEHLFDLTKVGLRVVIVPSDVAPSDIAHPSLFQPKPIEIAVATQPAS